MSECGEVCDVYSRVCGYFQPERKWNLGKRQEFKERVKFDVGKAKIDCDKFNETDKAEKKVNE